MTARDVASILFRLAVLGAVFVAVGWVGDRLLGTDFVRP